MELDSQTLRSVWWKGAISGALKGIPQGLLLGALGFGLIAGGIYLFGATSLVGTFGSFLFGDAAAATAAMTAGNIGSFIGTLSPLTFVVLNTALTVAGNFLTGGQIACNTYKQEAEHQQNAARIRQLEVRTQQLAPDPTTSRTVQAILAQGPRTSHAHAEQLRNQAPSQPTLH
jgi:hypothetical protein